MTARHPMVHGLVLDFDGVIVNSEPLHLRAFQEVLAAEGHALSAQEYYGRYVGLDDRAMFRAFAADHGTPSTSQDSMRDGSSGLQEWLDHLIAAKTARMQVLLLERSPLFPGGEAHIRTLAAAIPLAIASGALRHEIEQVLQAAGLADCFRAVVAASETPRGKPYPDPYSRAVELLGAARGEPLDPAHAAAVEDTLAGLASARAAGLRTIAVTTTYAAAALGDADAIVPTICDVTLPLLAEVIGR